LGHSGSLSCQAGKQTDPNSDLLEVALQKLQPLANEIRVSIDVFEVRKSDEIEGALGKLQRARPDGVLVAPDPSLTC
jgi:hypothetical protein